MIAINRQRVAPPLVLNPDRVGQAYDALEAFFRRPIAQRRQQRPFDLDIQYRASPELLAMTHGKCAYCERALSEDEVEVDAFRPTSMDLGPGISDHYWWLAYDWTNLLPACSMCVSAKRNLFPVNGKRAKAHTRGAHLEAEGAVLLDPCDIDPLPWFTYDWDGSMDPASWLDPEESYRARVTIEVLKLDRPDLRGKRSVVMAQMRVMVESLLSAHGNKEQRIILGAIKDSLSNANEYCASRRWAFYRLYGKLEERLPMAALKGQMKSCERMIQPLLIRDGSQTIVQDFPPMDEVGTGYRMAGLDMLTIKEVVIENFRVIRRIAFTIPIERPKDLSSISHQLVSGGRVTKEVHRTRGWKMLLGENGAGKSTILQAITLALMGESFYLRSRSLYGNLLRNGANSGSIRILFHERAEPLVVLLRKSGPSWSNNADGAQVFLRAYGATRLLPMEVDDVVTGSQPSKVASNLFNSFVPLIDATAWLRGLNSADFHHACISLKDLLSIDPNEGDLKFQHRPGKGRSFGAFGLQTKNGFTPLQHFSAGYQTILGLACDIMAGTGARSGDMRYVTGIVLVDEIGTNLHPRWRMRVLSSLERTFPGLQFISSTHEPLCLHGLGEGEVAVVERDLDNVRLNDDLPSPAGLRVDQLLTSEFFGLHTTLSPEVELDFQVYYDLLARKETLDGNGKRTLEELGQRLSGTGMMGSGPRDRLVLSLVDEFLAKKRAAREEEEVQQLSDSVRNAVFLALNRLDQSSGHVES